METYIGKKPNAGREVNLDEKVVLDLLEGIDAAGRNVTCDNFFTSLSCKKVAGKKRYSRGYNKKHTTSSVYDCTVEDVEYHNVSIVTHSHHLVVITLP